MDLIDREQALKALEEISYALWEVDIPSPTVPEYIEHHRDVQKVMDIADMWARKIQALPSARPKGKWKKISPAKIYECSVCGQEVMTQDIDTYKFCHGCGAEMEAE